ncbi:GNAT family N-acetyltransferase [Rubrobacter xylanophilus]|uniref:GNAT family N-acetyltransferase n=1 Tax=Rubrobacter xylanophilus TaxID=49319 RepID=UPI001C640BC5|nr:GNAT family N-acetyltransferase [Rubrobacter xylanophilus]
MRIRHVREGDAEALLDLRRQLDRETAFMLLEPGERITTISQETAQIRRCLDADNSTILVAEASGRLAGYLEAHGGEYRRNRRTAELVIGILQEFAGRGIGTALMSEAERWARRHGIHRLELTVMEHNETAISLYGKMGFDVEGRRRDSLFVEDSFVDELYMAKLLDIRTVQEGRPAATTRSPRGADDPCRSEPFPRIPRTPESGQHSA